MLKRVIVILSLLVPLMVGSQELVTDRPGFTESALVVPRKSLQIESGFEYAKSGAAKQYRVPNMLLRYGMHDKFEIRMEVPGWTKISEPANHGTFRNDIFTSLKIQCGRGPSARAALLLVTSFPVGNSEVSSGDAEYGFKFLAGFDLSASVSLDMNVGSFSRQVGDRRYIHSLISFSLGKGFSSRLGSFFELRAEMPENAPWTPMFDTGMTYLLTPLSQIDGYLGLGLNDHARDAIVGLGYSVRF